MSNPADQARQDHASVGANENPYPINTPEWREYEQTFDAIEIDLMKRGRA